MMMDKIIISNCTVLEYYRGNTQIGICDLFKFLYQSCFGCEHLVTDFDDAFNRIIKESECCENDDLPNVEFLDGDYCRVHLKALKTKDSLEWLCRAFIDSSKVHPEGEKRLEEQLGKLIEFSEAGIIKFDKEMLEREIDAWRKQGFPPIHHSELFRESHHPSYRVISTKYLQEINSII